MVERLRDPKTKRFIGSGRIKDGEYNAIYIRNRNKWPYVGEHIVVYEEYYKCCMLWWSVVHHIDGNPNNNSVENLQGMTRGQHIRLHSRKDMSDRYCLKCGSKTTLVHKGYANWHKLGNGFICRKCYQSGRYIERRAKNKTPTQEVLSSL